MRIRTVCPNPECGNAFSVSTQDIGRKARCKACGTRFVIRDGEGELLSLASSDAEAREQSSDSANIAGELSSDVRGADALNNRGLSLWHLGKLREAEEAFERALRADVHHLQATYNRFLLFWRTGRATDLDWQVPLNEITKWRAQGWELPYCKGREEGSDFKY